jgi:hypothetical protein
MNRRPLVLVTPLMLFIILIACNRQNADQAAPGSTAPPTATATSTGPVAFEPAYPEEVSTEGLSAADTAQQEVHRHGDGEAHSHGKGTTPHGHDH